MLYVKKRDGKTVDFDLSKIEDAIGKAFDAVGKSYTKEIIELLALRVTASFSDKVIKDTSTVICEHPYGENVPDFAGNLPKFRQYKYGKVAVTVYKRGEIDG